MFFFLLFAAVITLMTELHVSGMDRWRRSLPSDGIAATQPTPQRPLDVATAVRLLRHSGKRYVIVEAKNGLGNRLRALASAMSVAEYLKRPVLLVWIPDLHCNCSFLSLYHSAPILVVDEPLPLSSLKWRDVQAYNYMRGEPGALKSEPIEVDPHRHLYFKSAYVMNHPKGQWAAGGPQRHIQSLRPSPRVENMLTAHRGMIGLHVRNVFDAPRDQKTNVSVEGAEAQQGAEQEYGKDIAETLLRWRRASHWTNFVGRVEALIRQDNISGSGTLRFYLAADSDEAYVGLTKRFPGRMVLTRRECDQKRCDFRDCESLTYSLVDMLNLARTRLMLGSGYSSYSEVASHIGGQYGRPVPILMAGRDFGQIVESWRGRKRPRGADAEAKPGGDGYVPFIHSVQHFWPKPFAM